MASLKKVVTVLVISIVNTILLGSHFFELKRRLLILIGVKIGEKTKIVGPIHFGTMTTLSIGDNCYINRNFTIEGNGQVKIGDNCDIAPQVTILTGSHEIGNSQRRAGNGIIWNYEIGSGTWIGARTTILNGARIMDGVVIGVGSVVNKDCERNSIFVGVPARQIKFLDN